MRSHQQFTADFLGLCERYEPHEDQLAALQLLLDKEELDRVLSGYWRYCPPGWTLFDEARSILTDYIPF